MDVKHVVAMAATRSDYHGYQTVGSCLFVRTIVDVYMLNLYISICVFMPHSLYLYLLRIIVFLMFPRADPGFFVDWGPAKPLGCRGGRGRGHEIEKILVRSPLTTTPSQIRQ